MTLTTRDKALAISGALFLGLLGNALWELAFKPGGYWLGKVIFSVVTLGSSTLKDSIYLEAAKGNHELASSLLLASGIGLLMGASAASGTLPFLGTRLTRAAAGDSFADRAATRLRSIRKRVAYLTTGLFLVCLGFIVVEGLRVIQANSAYTYFTQSFTICRPYLDEKQAQLLQSEFAMVQGRSDYLAVVQRLHDVAASHQLILPKYTPW